MTDRRAPPRRKPKRGKQKRDGNHVPNAEPSDDEFNSKKKLFGDFNGYYHYGHDEDLPPPPPPPPQEPRRRKKSNRQTFDTQLPAGKTTRASHSTASERKNFVADCSSLCDMEPAFEVMEIVILLLF